jgi:monofunctional biosynthetic peptidoglycan transglycosylase
MLRDLVLMQGYDRQWVSIDKISPVLVQSVMMSEDGQYCFHGGVDWDEMRMLVTDTLGGKSTRGGSTIPMQTAKNLFLWNSRSFVRKAMELPLAVTAASKLTSRQAALLAVSLPNPIDRNAGKPGRGLRRLAAVIERRARGSGEYIRCIYD